MQHKNKQAFTLVEMMIVVSLLFMLLTFAYLPYAHYQEKLKIRQAIREASQTILESRNLAINGYDKEIAWNFENRALGVYFSLNDKENSKIYSYDIDNEFLDNDPESKIASIWEEYQTRKLPTGTEFEWVTIKNNVSDFQLDAVVEGVLFYYYPITGESDYFSVKSGRLEKIENDKIYLEFSYRDSPSPVLRKILQYDTRVHIIDYGKWVTEL